MSRIGIIGAMHQECVHLEQQLQVNKCTQYLNIRITYGSWAGHEVCLLESGMGKVNATLAAEWLVREFHPDLLINTGSAGGVKAEAKVGDFVIADQVCHHDIDITPIGFSFGELPQLPVYYPIQSKWLKLLDQVAKQQNIECHMGTIASGESFIYQDEQVETIQSRFANVVACEMEAAAVAQVCYLHGTDFLVLRNLSDVAGAEAPNDFNQYIEQAGVKSSTLVLTLIAAIIQD